MKKSVELYKNFIDGLVKIRSCVLSIWVKEKGWPNFPENEKINKLLSELSKEQKSVIAEMLQEARDGGIHDVLAYLNDEINIEEMRITKEGIELAIEPYGTEMYYDWVCRREGDNWPDHMIDERYK